MKIYNSSLVVKKDDFSSISIKTSVLALLKDGQILLKILKFGFSANNITYLALGKSYKYFDFFPVKDDSLAICPVWGIALVIDSRVAEVNPNELIYGFFPMSQYSILTPTKITDLFFNVSRPQLPADRRVYNQYFRCKNDPDYAPDHENLMILYRPLWTTSFFLDDYLQVNDLFLADTVLISSASSKTAYCLALILKNRGIAPIGLTSTRNIKFVESLGYYKKVADYNDILKMDASGRIVYVDVAGSSRLNDIVYNHFGPQLLKHVGVGLSHYNQDASENDSNSGGMYGMEKSKFEMFFAPAWIQFRMPMAKDDLVKRKEKGF
jgi:NADPH-dependent curcumin reductase CurA